MIALTLVSAGIVRAQDAPVSDPTGNTQPTAYAVLFYSTTCPHCHTVIEEHLPLMYDEFGDQLQVLFVETSSQGGSYLLYSTCQALDVPDNVCGGVPMVAIGDQWLVGAFDIPNEMPGIIREGLANGGIDLPLVEPLRDAYSHATVEEGERAGTATGEVAPAEAAAADAEAANSGEAISTAAGTNRTIWENLAADPEANAMAVVVLGGLIISLGLVLAAWNRPETLAGWASRGALIAAAAGVAVAFTLASDATGRATAPGILAWSALALLFAAGLLVLKPNWRDLAIPVVALAGLLVAVYLAHVETTETTAVCGAIGDCSTVQQSPYATLFGVLPVGVFGIIGYLLIIVAWGMNRLRPNPMLDAALLGMTLFGTAFSVYLTFLEPFVIGATCAWCITSALTMAALLWLTAPRGIAVLKNGLVGQSSAPART